MFPIDHIEIAFASEGIFFVNISLAFIMFGIALGLTPKHFIDTLRTPKKLIAGLLSQLLLLPLLTLALVHVINPAPSIALGMILVSVCPGGNISNFISSLAKGNVALSVSLTAFTSVTAILWTPFGLSFWSSFYEPSAAIIREIEINFLQVFITILCVIAIPLVIGMQVKKYFPKFTSRIMLGMRIVSIAIFFVIVAIALFSNLDIFFNYLPVVFVLVLLHNAIALCTGYYVAVLFKLPKADRRALSIETGIQNSGLGLLLIFTFFNGLGGMALVTAWWGIWHFVSGLGIAFYWGRR